MALEPAPALQTWGVPRPRRPAVVDVLTGVAGIGLGITLALAVMAESSGSLRAAGGVATALGRVTGLTGTYLLLIAVMLVARLPALERVVGQDRLVAWHRRLAPWPLFLLAAHGALITVGYAQAGRTGVVGQFGTLLGSYPGVFAATAGFGLLAMAGLTSYRIARRRMRHETWWVVHLYTYLALALSFSHQIATGASFVGNPVARAWWIVLWLATAGAVLAYRFGMPVWRSVRHRLRVVGVHHESPGVVSLVCEGRALDRLAVAGGQFFQWRFLEPGLWWQAHPYTLSALPSATHLRVTVKDLGDHSAALSRLRPGTRVAIEGPYGAFTRHARTSDRVVLVGAGVGITPIRALLEDLPRHVEADVILRGSSHAELPLLDEVRALVSARGDRLHELVGPRSTVRVDPRTLRRLVPDIASCDVYVCGPRGFTSVLVDAARGAGVAASCIHREAFDL